MQAVREIEQPKLEMGSKTTTADCDPFWTWQKVALAAASVLGLIATIGHPTNSLPFPIIFISAISSAMLFTAVGIDAIVEKIKKRRVKPLTHELLDFMASSPSFGLRCVPNGDVYQADDEKNHGVFGDSLNLDPTAENVWNKFYPDDTPNQQNYTKRDLFKLNRDWVSPEIKQTICKRWGEGVDDFIRVQLVMGELTPVFLLIQYPEKTTAPYDLEQYGKGLGKHGRRLIESQDILCVIYPPTDRTLTDDELVRYYRSQLIREIKKQAASD